MWWGGLGPNLFLFIPLFPLDLHYLISGLFMFPLHNSPIGFVSILQFLMVPFIMSREV